MARSRNELSERLHSLVENVYYTPPEGRKIQYPCIIYELESQRNDRADNIRYKTENRYLVTSISKQPDEATELRDKILDAFPYISSDRRYISDSLVHDVMTLYW